MKVSIISSLITLAAVASAAPAHHGAQPAGWGSPVNVVKRAPEPILEARGGGRQQGGHSFSSGFGKREEEVAEPVLEARGGGRQQGGHSFSSGFGKREEEVAEPALEARGGGRQQGGHSFSSGFGKRGYGGFGARKPGSWTSPQGFNQDRFPLGGNTQPQQLNGSPQGNPVFQGVNNPQANNQVGGDNTNRLNVDSQANDRGQGSPLNQPFVNNAAVLSNTADTTETESATVQINGGSNIQIPMGTIVPVSNSNGPVTRMTTNSGNCMPFTAGANGAKPELMPNHAFSAGTPLDLTAQSSSDNVNSLTNGEGVRFVWCQLRQFDPTVRQIFGIRNLQ